VNTAVNLTLIVNGRSGRAVQPWVRKKLLAAAPLLPRNRLQEVVITLAGDRMMSDLHSRSHNDPTPTDVLTYEVDHDPRGSVTEGQVVVCVPEARRRVRNSGTIAVRNEILLYALHGILHLCGLDDQSDSEFARMHALEDRILKKIGVGAVFRRDGEAA
jgi:probable rRNA maturation factor